MYWQFMWFVLAGFVLGFVVSTLWEWFHFRRERMILRDEQIDALEAKLQAVERRQAAADRFDTGDFDTDRFDTDRFDADNADWLDGDAEAAATFVSATEPEPPTIVPPPGEPSPAPEEAPSRSAQIQPQEQTPDTTSHEESARAEDRPEADDDASVTDVATRATAEDADITAAPIIGVVLTPTTPGAADDADITEGPAADADASDFAAATDADVTEGPGPVRSPQANVFAADAAADADVTEGIDDADAAAFAAAFAAADADVTEEPPKDAATSSATGAAAVAAADADITEGPVALGSPRGAPLDTAASAAADADVTEGPADAADAAVAAAADADITEGATAAWAQRAVVADLSLADSSELLGADAVVADTLFEPPYTVAPNVDASDLDAADSPVARADEPAAQNDEPAAQRDEPAPAAHDADVTSAEPPAGRTDEAAPGARIGVAAAAATIAARSRVGTAPAAASEDPVSAADVSDELAQDAFVAIHARGLDIDAAVDMSDAPRLDDVDTADAETGASDAPAATTPEAGAVGASAVAPAVAESAVEPAAEPATPIAASPAPDMLEDLSDEELVNLTVDRLANAAAKEGAQSLVLSPKARAELAAMAAEFRTHAEQTRTTEIDLGAAGEEDAADSVTETDDRGAEEVEEEAGDAEESNTGYPDNLSMIKGIGPTYRARLYEAGITTWRQVAEADVEELRRIARPPVNADVEEWPERARALAEKHKRLDAVYIGPAPDDFTKIRGIGRHGMYLLYRAGICTFDQLLRAPIDKLAEVIPASPNGEKIDYAAWIEHAQRQVERRRSDT